MATQEIYKKYVERMRKIADVNFATGVLQWDKEVNLPPKSAEHRSQQVASLSSIAHELFVDEDFGSLLERLGEEKGVLNVKQGKNVALTLKDYLKRKKYSTDFVVRTSKAVSNAYHAWVKAREANDFKVYQEALHTMVELKREEAEIIGYEDHPYDALMDEFEPGIKTAEVATLFKEVRKQLVDFVGAIKQAPQIDNNFLFKNYNKDVQWQFGLDVLKDMGFDFDTGRQDLSIHPFTTSFSPLDVRLTTRISENDFNDMTWSCIHEGGHGLYEQGLKADEYGLPLGQAASLGIHESQARLWENNIGRGLLFWQANYERLQKLFPENLQNVSVEQFYKGINRIEPNLIRTESDELHYHFHVAIRFELEKAMIDGSLAVKDLRDAWNDKYKTYLGVDVPNDKKGVLQDIHWAHGAIGYFATYSLGSFYAAQFYQHACKDIPTLQESIARGDLQPLLDWLRTNIHQHGRFYTSQELCKEVTGEGLDFKYFMDYAKQKYSTIYDL